MRPRNFKWVNWVLSQFYENISKSHLQMFHVIGNLAYGSVLVSALLFKRPIRDLFGELGCVVFWLGIIISNTVLVCGDAAVGTFRMLMIGGWIPLDGMMIGKKLKDLVPKIGTRMKMHLKNLQPRLFWHWRF